MMRLWVQGKTLNNGESFVAAGYAPKNCRIAPEVLRRKTAFAHLVGMAARGVDHADHFFESRFGGCAAGGDSSFSSHHFPTSKLSVSVSHTSSLCNG